MRLDAETLTVLFRLGLDLIISFKLFNKFGNLSFHKESDHPLELF